MNKTVEETRRELFEQSITILEGVCWSVETNSYIGTNFWVVQHAWETFNAALDAVVIELPLGAPNYMSNDEESCFLSGVEACRTAIESTNLGIKIK